MAREVNDKNQIWFEQDGNVTKIGFTQNFIDTALNQCWHILPGSRTKIKKKSPLFVVETNDGMVTIMSPVAGYYRDFIGEKAQDFPDQITSADVILSVSDQQDDARPVAREVELRGVEAIIARQQQRVDDELRALRGALGGGGRAGGRAGGNVRWNEPVQPVDDDAEF